MKDTKTLAYLNMHGILGCLEDLCRFSPEAKKLASVKPTAVSFAVKDGPSMTLRFEDGACTVEHEGAVVFFPAFIITVDRKSHILLLIVIYAR